MKALGRQLVLLALCTGFWHAVVGAVSMVVVPPRRTVDSLPASETIYLTDVKVVAAGIAGLGATQKPKLIFFGPSNVTAAFRPNELRPLFPEYEVHQLGLGFHNLTHSLLEARLMTQTLPPEVLQQSVFVLGVWYGAFAENGNPRLFDLQGLFLRSGLFVRRDGQVAPIAGPAWLPIWLTLLRPFYFVQYLAESRLGTYKPHEVDRYVTAPPVGNEREESLAAIDTWLRRPDHTLADEQFEELVEVAKTITGAGARLVVVEMAMPRWHTEHAHYLTSYAQQRARVRPRLLALPGTVEVDLSQDDTLLADELFYDLNHPKLEATHLWAEALRERFSGASSAPRRPDPQPTPARRE